MNHRFATHKFYPKRLNFGRFNLQRMAAVVTLGAALCLILSIPASAEIDVEVIARQEKLGNVEGYV